jgi:hypothetical protein
MNLLLVQKLAYAKEEHSPNGLAFGEEEHHHSSQQQ